MKNSLNNCKITGCTREHHSKGYCELHYRRFLKHGNPLKTLITYSSTGLCTVPGCAQKHHGNGYCGKHWWRNHLYGDTSFTKYHTVYPKNTKCKVPTCENRGTMVRDFCNAHYKRFMNYGDPNTIKITPKGAYLNCSIQGCKAKPCGRFCPAHRNWIENKKLREALFHLLGHVCHKCGEFDKRVLQFDHKNGGGEKERRRLKSRQFYKYYLEHPVEAKRTLNVSCANCNWRKRYEKDEVGINKSN